MLDAPRRAAASRWVEPQPSLMLRPSGSAWIAIDLGAGLARTPPARRRTAAPLRAVDDDLEAVQPVRQRRRPGGRRSASTAVGVRRGPGRPPAPVGRVPAPRRIAAPRSRPRASSASLMPPRAKNLMPLSGIGLCRRRASRRGRRRTSPVRYATAGVGSTPTRATSTPALARPATTAASRNSPEARGSRPTTATGAVPGERAGVAEHVRGRDRQVERQLGGEVDVGQTAYAVGTEESSHCRPPDRVGARTAATDATLRGPQTSGRASVRRARLALAVLRSLAGLLQTGLLALLDPRRHGSGSRPSSARGGCLRVDARSAHGRCRGAARRPGRRCRRRGCGR